MKTKKYKTRRYAFKTNLSSRMKHEKRDEFIGFKIDPIDRGAPGFQPSPGRKKKDNKQLKE